jgi:hypothetical protein
VWGGYFKKGVKVLKRIFSIVILVVIIGIMALPTMAWDGYPDTPIISNKYDESYIYQVIIKRTSTYNYEINLLLSKTPIYIDESDDDYLKNASGDLYFLRYQNGNWVYGGGVSGLRYFEILQSSHDIYTDSSLTSVFFSASPKTPMQEVLTQHPPLTLMTPQRVGMITYLIGLLIASVAFLKGLQLLFKTLRKA